MSKTMFDLDALRKAKQTYKSTQPIGAGVGAVTGMKQPLPSGLPPVASMAASKVKVGAPMVTPTAKSSAQKMVASTQPRTEQTLNNISSAVNTPFSYDANSDPAYQAAVKQAQQELSMNQKNTNAQLRATGQGKSSYSETVANQLANQTTENIANNILPQYATQAYNQRQDTIANQGNLYGLQYQQDVTTPQNEAAITGNYLPPAAKTAINSLLALKQQAETKGITATDRAALSTQADGIRSQLKALGIDPTAYGADKTAAAASAVNPGIRTLQGQQQDQSAQGQAFDQKTTTRQLDTADKQYTENFAYQKARDAISDTQWQSTFDENVKQNGLSYALNALQEQNSTAYQQAQIALSEDDNSRAWAQLDAEQSQPSAAEKGLSANQVLDNVTKLYQEPIYTTDISGKQVDTGKTQLTKDPAKRIQMFETVVDSDLSEKETRQVLLSSGFTMKEIESMIKQYSGE